MSRLSLVVVAALLAITTVALALDSMGRTGRIHALEVNHSTADTYLQYHGRVTVDNGVAKDTYSWGGTSCSNKILSDSKVSMLQQAMDSGATIEPRFQAGQGSNRCLVGFVIVAP